MTINENATIEFTPREIEITRSFESDDLSEKGLREFQSLIANGQSEMTLIKDLIGASTSQMWIKASWSKFQQFVQRVPARAANQKSAITTTYHVEQQSEHRDGLV